MRQPLLNTLLTSGILLMSMEAFSAQGVYISAAGGISQLEYEEFETGRVSQLVLGYNFVDWFGIEAGATNLGEFKVDGGSSSVEVETRHVGLSLNGASGFGRIEAQARFMYYQADLSPDIPNAASTEDSSDNGFSYGANFIYPFNKHFKVFTGWQYFNHVDGPDINAYLIGAQLQF